MRSTVLSVDHSRSPFCTPKRYQRTHRSETLALKSVFIFATFVLQDCCPEKVGVTHAQRIVKMYTKVMYIVQSTYIVSHLASSTLRGIHCPP
jgi:hypothetical protein